MVRRIFLGQVTLKMFFLANTPTKKLIKIRPLLMTVQILLALLLAWLVFELLTLKKRFKKPTWKETFKYIFISEKHWLFWLMTLISVAVFSFWLLGQWPGSASPDSFYQLYQTNHLF